MELDVNAVMSKLDTYLERLSAMTESMENAANLQKQRADVQEGDIGKITAAVEPGEEIKTKREMELERQLAQAETALATLRAEIGRSERAASERKTLPAATLQLLAKQGLDANDSLDLHSIDAALTGLSVENRIAIKSQLMRTGALTLRKTL